MKAGPGAASEMDFETLNGPKPHPLLSNGQDPATPAINVQTTPPTPPPLQADAAQSKAAAPNATAIKAVAVLAVTGASTQGNKELTAALRKIIKKAGWPVRDKPGKDALSIQGRVVLDAAQGPNQAVRLDWVVLAPKGKDLGHVAQSNQVPAHALDASWGIAADYAAQAAAEGIFKLIAQYR